MTKKQTVVYGVMGEGRGHATRSAVVIDELTARGYEVHILTSGDALAFFNQGGYKRIHPIGPVTFIYEGTRLNNARMLTHYGPAVIRLDMGRGRAYREVLSLITRLDPALIITDVEPYTAYVARRLRIPFVTIDHQSFLLAPLPRGLSWRSYLQGRVYQALYRHVFRDATSRINCSFYRPDFDQRHASVLSVGHLVRSVLRKDMG